MVNVNTHWRHCGLQVVRLENEFICVDVLPELGAKIYNLTYRPSSRNLLWHNPHVLPARQTYRANFDDVWSGGWDELIPNDLPTPVNGGEILPDHGEVWSQQSDWKVIEEDASGAMVRFANYGRVLPTLFEKTISLRSGESQCILKYKYANLGPRGIDFLWNIHPALTISPETWLDVPAHRGIVDPWRTDQFKSGSEYEWPHAVDRAGREVDLRRVSPPESAVADHHYLTNISAGWYAATDTRAKVGFGLVFPADVFPHLWLFRTFGGWRGLYTLVLEASTGYPNDLAIARQRGHCGHLKPGETIEAEVRAIAFSGFKAVEQIYLDGTVVPGKPSL